MATTKNKSTRRINPSVKLPGNGNVKPKTYKVTPKAVAKLGPTLAQTRSQFSKQQWDAMMAYARNKGLTREGSLSVFGITPGGQQTDPTPLSLAAHNEGWIKQQATQQTTAAFAPAQKVLDERQKRIMALDAKRQRDHGFYNEWVQQQLTNINTQAYAADAHLASSAASIAANTPTGAGGYSTTTPVAGMTGTAEGTPSMGIVDAAKQASATGLGAAAQNVVTTAASNGRSRSDSQANALAYMAALKAQLDGDTSTDLQGVDDARLGLTSDRASAYNDIANGLRTTEVNKGADNADRAIVRDQLNLDKTKVAADLAATGQKTTEWKQAFKERMGISWDRYNRMGDQERLRWKKRWARAGMKPVASDGQKVNQWGFTNKEWRGMSQAERQKVINLQRNDKNGDGKVDRGDLHGGAGALPRDTAKPGSRTGTGTGADGPSEGDKKNSREMLRGVTNALSALTSMHKRSDAGVEGWANNRDPKGRTFKERLRTQGYDALTADLAENIRFNDGRITMRGVRIAKQLGILHPEQVWRVVPPKERRGPAQRPDSTNPGAGH